LSKIHPNTFQVPNFYVDEVMHLLTGTELALLLYAVRRIMGFHKQRDRISLSQFCNGARGANGEIRDHGTGLGRSTVIHGLAYLVEVGLLVKADENNLSNDGACYELEMDSNNVRLDILQARAGQKAERAIRQTESARQSQSVEQTRGSLLNRPGVVSPTDQRWSVQQTGGSQSNRPEVVCSTDTQKPEENQKKTRGKTRGKTSPPPTAAPHGELGTALEDVFPGHATNFSTMRELAEFALSLKATAADVRAFPSWLAARYPTKALSPWAFKDLFHVSLAGQPQPPTRIGGCFPVPEGAVVIPMPPKPANWEQMSLGEQRRWTMENYQKAKQQGLVA
jgi:hypothetical protein